MNDTTELPELTDSVLGRPADRSRWLALVVLCTGMLMIVLDTTIPLVNVSTQVTDTARPPRQDQGNGESSRGTGLRV